MATKPQIATLALHRSLSAETQRRYLSKKFRVSTDRVKKMKNQIMIVLIIIVLLKILIYQNMNKILYKMYNKMKLKVLSPCTI